MESNSAGAAIKGTIGVEAAVGAADQLGAPGRWLLLKVG
jgi:hypothetical protein